MEKKTFDIFNELLIESRHKLLKRLTWHPTIQERDHYPANH